MYAYSMFCLLSISTQTFPISKQNPSRSDKGHVLLSAPNKNSVRASFLTQQRLINIILMRNPVLTT